MTLDPRFLFCRDPVALPPPLRRPVLAIGNFDGMHLGHRAVIDAACGLAADSTRPAALLTFEPHPRSYFRPEAPVFRLTPSARKAALAAGFGLQGMIELSFDRSLAATSAAEFVTSILIGRFGVAGLAVGHDFSFGKGKGGSAADLAEAGTAHGFPVRIVPPLELDGEIVSSSAIRAALAAGRPEYAARLMGRPYAITVEVVHGKKLGRTIGYPTANIALAPNTGLKMGIYAVRARLDGQDLTGVASFGTRPTFDNGPPLLEVFLFDFDGDLYGRELEVSFIAYLRAEMKFDGVDALVRQMDADSALARRILAG